MLYPFDLAQPNTVIGIQDQVPVGYIMLYYVRDGLTLLTCQQNVFPAQNQAQGYIRFTNVSDFFSSHSTCPPVSRYSMSHCVSPLFLADIEVPAKYVLPLLLFRRSPWLCGYLIKPCSPTSLIMADNLSVEAACRPTCGRSNSYHRS